MPIVRCLNTSPSQLLDGDAGWRYFPNCILKFSILFPDSQYFFLYPRNQEVEGCAKNDKWKKINRSQKAIIQISPTLHECSRLRAVTKAVYTSRKLARCKLFDAACLLLQTSREMVIRAGIPIFVNLSSTCVFPHRRQPSIISYKWRHMNRAFAVARDTCIQVSFFIPISCAFRHLWVIERQAWYSSE